MKKSSGHSLSEHGMIATLIAVAAIGALTLLSQAIQGQFHQLSKTPNPAASFLTPMAPAAPVGGASGAAVSGSTLPSTGVDSSTNVLKTYQELANSVQTAGANGTTTILADSLTKLTQEQLAAGNLTETQANTLVALANQAYRIAGVEAAVEKLAASNTLTGQAFLDQKITFDGRTTTMHYLYTDLGFTLSNDLQTDPLSAISVARPETETFIKLYDQVVSSGALDDPTIKAQVQGYATQIATLSDAVMFAAMDRGQVTMQVDLNADMTTRLNRLDGSASATTTADGNSICTVGSGTSTATGSGSTCTAN